MASENVHIIFYIVVNKKIGWNQKVRFCWQIWLSFFCGAWTMASFSSFSWTYISISAFHTFWSDRMYLIRTFPYILFSNIVFFLSPKICQYIHGVGFVFKINQTHNLCFLIGKANWFLFSYVMSLVSLLNIIITRFFEKMFYIVAGE